jgi:hypothetical protein
MKSEAGRPREIDFFNIPITFESRSPLLLGRCSRQLRESCSGANMVYLQAERAIILEHYFATKSFAAVHEALSNAYPDNTPTGNKVSGLRKCLQRETCPVSDSVDR